MADFRVPLGFADGVERELDWDQAAGDWSLSERGLGEGWAERLTPVPGDWDVLREFFFLTTPLPQATLCHLSPGELVLLHTNTSRDRRLVAKLCSECGNHWHVYRAGRGKEWKLYGRTCSFSWFKGDLVSSDQIPN